MVVAMVAAMVLCHGMAMVVAMVVAMVAAMVLCHGMAMVAAMIAAMGLLGLLLWLLLWFSAMGWL